MGEALRRLDESATLSTFMVRLSMKELLARGAFDTLDALARAVEADLTIPGRSLGPADRIRIRRVVEEEGYTGRFAIDDVIRRRLGKKWYWPLLSLGLALALFTLSSVASAIIESMVQGSGECSAEVSSSAR